MLRGDESSASRFVRLAPWARDYFVFVGDLKIEKGAQLSVRPALWAVLVEEECGKIMQIFSHTSCYLLLPPELIA